MEIVEARGAGALEALRSEWEGLLESSSRATIYQTWEWNAAWWHAYHRNKRLRLLEVRDAGALVGVVPLYVSRHLGTPLRRLAFLGTGAADYLDVIAADDRAADVADATLRYLYQARGFDLSDLQQLSPSAHLREAALDRADSPDPRYVALVPQEPCPFVALPDTWEAYTARLGKKMRSNVGYYERLIPKTFEDAETRLATPDELPAAMGALFDLHQRRWNARLLPGVLGSGRVQAFHRDVARRFQARGWLRLHITRVGKRIVAALYCYCFRGRYYYYLGGFEPELAKYSLGTVLTAHAMRAALAEGCAEFDFLRGNEPYKYRWQPEERVNERLLLGRPHSLRSHAMVRLNRLERFVEHQAKAFAEKRGRGPGK